MILQGLVLPLEAALFQGLGDSAPHLLQAEGLGDVVEGTLAHGRHRRLQGGEGGDKDDLHVRIAGLAATQHLQAVHLVHLEIGQHQIEGLAVEQAQGLGTALSGGDGIALAGQDVVQVAQGDLFVVDDEDAGRHGAASGLASKG